MNISKKRDMGRNVKIGKCGKKTPQLNTDSLIPMWGMKCKEGLGIIDYGRLRPIELGLKALLELTVPIFP